ncbi:MAG: hypothetical protein IM535_05825 [Pseudanabaena sp. M38BS1SP1A06MG]|jgi:hypothetical protein|nr:hypothetical protein [Pseudanabaena sp. M38BS1SP1A06MG]
MALKIGRVEVGLRLLLSFTTIAIAHGYLGSYISTFITDHNYPIASLLLGLAVAGIFAIPQSLGGLLAAIASVIIVYWQAGLMPSLVTLGVCLVLYWLGFADLGYSAKPDKKLSIIEILSTIVTFALAIALTISLLQIPSSWIASLAIGLLAATITLIGKQIQYLELSTIKNFIILGILTSSSLAIGFVVRTIFYTPKPTEFL